jgi:MoaA/NifB/PqqE/SkfB family radical SAM enzyme
MSRRRRERRCQGQLKRSNTTLLKDIEHALQELANAGVKQIIVSGGEPCLHDDLSDVVEYAKKEYAISQVAVLSNGTCFTEQVLVSLTPFVDCVSVFFDGFSEESPAYIRQSQHFEELSADVRAVKTLRIGVHIISIIHAKNIADLIEYVALSKKLGATLNFSLLTCRPNDKTLSDLLSQEEELAALGWAPLTLDNGHLVTVMDAPTNTNLIVKHNCGTGYRGLSITADETIYPCHISHRSANKTAYAQHIRCRVEHKLFSGK